MSLQRRIEDEAGIDDAVAAYIMEAATPAAQTAMAALRLAVARYEAGAVGILHAAVSNCKREMAALAKART